jgi:HEAT repeat protein
MGLMCGLLKDGDFNIREKAAYVLSVIGDAGAVELLCSVLKDDSYMYARRYAAVALGRIGDARAVGPLLSALKDKEVYVRLAAVKALGDIGDARAVEPLCALLDDNDVDIRIAAAEALGKIGDRHAIDRLCALLGNSPMSLRKKAAEALMRIMKLETASDESEFEIDILSAVGDKQAAGVLCNILNDKSSEYKRRIYAAKALVKLYRSRNDSDDIKQLILSQRMNITDVHEDKKTGMSSDCTHNDEWTKVEFPL